MTLAGMPGRTVAVVLLALIAMSAIPIILYSTKYGPGITPDSIMYIRAARNFSEGHGVTLESGEGFQKLTHFAPLFPVAISVVSRIGFSLETSAYYLNMVLLVSNVFLAGLISLRMMQSSIVGAIICSFLTLTSIYILEDHAMLWSEPIAIFFGFCGILLFAEHLKNQRLALLFLSAFLFGLALLSRYAAFAFIVGAVSSLLVLSKVSWRRRLLESLVLGGVASLPLILWIGGVPVAGKSRVHDFVVHFVRIDDLNSALYTVSCWLVPESIPGIYKRIALAIFVFWVGYLTYSFWKRDTKREPFLLLLFFVVSYVLLIAFSISFIRYDVGADPRILSPVYFASMLLVVFLFDVLWDLRVVRIAGAGFILVLGLSYVFRTGEWMLNARTNGLGYNSPIWQESEILERVRYLPPGTLIYSNRPELIHFFAGRPSSLFPRQSDHATLLRNPRYQADLEAMERDLEAQQGVMVVFYGRELMTELPTIGQLKKSLPLEVVEGVKDGAIFRIRNDSANP